MFGGHAGRTRLPVWNRTLRRRAAATRVCGSTSRTWGFRPPSLAVIWALQSQTGPPTRTLDMSIFKDFRITENWRVQFRAESFNLANTPVFNTPDGNLQDARSLGGNGNFGKITGTAAASERHIQFSLRLRF